MKIVKISVVMMLAALCVGCETGPRTMESIYKKYGTPDLVVEAAGSVERRYLPSQPPAEKWPLTKVYLYYVGQKSVVQVPARGPIRGYAIDDAEAAAARSSVEELKRAAATRPAAR